MQHTVYTAIYFHANTLTRISLHTHTFTNTLKLAHSLAHTHTHTHAHAREPTYAKTFTCNHTHAHAYAQIHNVQLLYSRLRVIAESHFAVRTASLNPFILKMFEG